jgi:ion channel-forming bestrophin family protein
MLIVARIPFRYIFRKARRELVSVLVLSTAIELLVSHDKAYLPPIQLPLVAFLGTAISLLLSFKLNQSYDRWWEARKIWGAIVNDSRTLVRQVLSFPAKGAPTAIAERIARRQMAWCYCLGQSLRGLDWKVGALEHLSEEDVREAEKHANKALALLQLHAQDLTRMCDDGILSDYRRVAVDDTLRRLTDEMGMAERIRSTVFPRTYRLFLRAFIYLFLGSLSIALAELEGVWQVVITTVVSIPFFLLEKTAFHMQDPFENRPTDTAMTAIARTIEINIRQLLGDEKVPPPLAPEGFYLM